MSRPWYKLNIDVSYAIRPDVDICNVNEDQMLMTKLPHQLTDLFTDSWLEYMKSIDLEVLAVIIFNRPIGQCDLEAHIDVANSGVLSCAINWVVNSTTSKMIWYNYPGTLGDQKLTSDGGQYVAWPIDTVQKIDECNINHVPTLVRVNIPHSIEMDNNPRVCVSVRTVKRSNDWEEIVNMFGPHIIQE